MILEEEFSDLAESLLSSMKKNNFSTENLTLWISTLPRSINVYVFPLWQSISKKLSGSYSLDGLFSILNMEVWNILDYNLLEHFIKKSRSHELSVGIKKYISELEEFKKETLVSDFIKCWEGHSRDFPDYDELKIKFDEQHLTLATLDKFRKTLVKKCIPSLLEYSGWIYYKHFRSGCFEVTWTLPMQLADRVKRNVMVMYEVLKAFKVRKVIVAGTSI